MSALRQTRAPRGRKKTAEGKTRNAAALVHESQHMPSPEGAKEMRGLPSGWRWARMSEVCSRVQDGTHFSPKEQARTGDFKYITAKNIKHWGLDLSELTYVPEQVHREIYKRCNVEKGDVLYIKDGVTTGIATVNTLDEEFSLLSSVALLKPQRDILDSLFLKYYLNSPEGFRNMTGQMTGTAIKRLILLKIKAALVPVAPLIEQRRIVTEIEKQFTRLEAGVAALRRVQANIKRYRAAVLKAACEGRLVPTEAELQKSGLRGQKAKGRYEPAEALLARILTERRQNWQGRGKYKEPAAPDTTNLPPLPNDWTWASVGQLGDVQLGRQRSPKNVSKNYPTKYVRAANIT
jgi:type I restriction enzyme, S subunit